MQTMEEKPKSTLRKKYKRINGKWQLVNEEKNCEADSINVGEEASAGTSGLQKPIKDADEKGKYRTDDFNEVRWRPRSPLKEMQESDEESDSLKVFHGSKEDLFQGSSDSEVDQDRMMSRELEKAARRHEEALVRPMRQLTMLEEIRNEYTPVLGQTSRRPQSDPNEAQDDEF